MIPAGPSDIPKEMSFAPRCRPLLAAACLAPALGCASPATGTVDVIPAPTVIAVAEPAPTPATSAPAPTPAPTASVPKTAPTPFDADAIRGATKDGRSYVFLVKDGGQPKGRRKMVFSEVTDEGATLTSSNQDLFGHPKGEPDVKKVTWNDLMAHATYPAEATTITEASVKVPAGSYDCKLYTVKESEDGQDQVTRAWFAKSLPGAPVKHEVERGSKVVRTLELFSHRPGS